MAGSNILTRKQLEKNLEKLTNGQLIDFAMKPQGNLTSKQPELTNDNKEL